LDLFGFVVGLIARAVVPGREPLGLIGTTLLGNRGALVAGNFGKVMGWYRPDEGVGFVVAALERFVCSLFIFSSPEVDAEKQ